MLRSHVAQLRADIRQELCDVQMLHPNVRRLFCGGRKLIHQGGKIMAFKRRSSQVLSDAQTRAANLKAIDPNLDLGNELTVADYESRIAAAQNVLDSYNVQLAKADALGNDFKAIEKEVRGFSSRMLAGVGVQYGKDSNEYEMAGGTRSSEIRRKKKPEEPPA
jgi:hypothetical protein